MEFLSLLYQFIFMPLQIMFEVIYYIVFKMIGNPGMSIVALSFTVNLLVLPLYNRADAIQEAERYMEEKLSKGVEHIKKTFKGDEQLMLLQTYYRQNGYSPMDSIKGSISLFLEIPFFVAAYQFLSNLEILTGASFGPIRDLGVQDGLLTFAGITINILPFVMTAVNLISAYVFTKDLNNKTKIQLYGMACFFLVFLYTSPAGLVFYWTLNNVFNLVKTIVYKMDDVEKGIDISMGLCGVFIIIYGSLLLPNTNTRNIAVSILLAILLNSRGIYRLIRNKFPYEKEFVFEKPRRKIFFAGAMFLAILIGILIPSAVIESSPQEFIVSGYLENPLFYLANSSSIALGVFVLWGGVFYWLTPDKHKAKIEHVLWCVVGIAIINYMFFGKDLGILNSTLQYENGVRFKSAHRIINLVVVLATICILNVIWKRYRGIIFEVLVIGSIALSGMIAVNVVSITDSLQQVDSKAGIEKTDGAISLSRNGQNVVVFMLDRAMGEYIPYIFNERPEFKEQFYGFTYYANTLSHGGHTVFGAPGLFGGYEYTPIEMNKRNDELLVDKHNEALKIMPVIFADAGYHVGVFNPPYNNYQEITDFNFFDEYPNINMYINHGRTNKGHNNSSSDVKQIVEMNTRNFYCFAVFKCAPIVLQRSLYDGGNYLSGKVFNQKITSLYTAIGTPKGFVNDINKLSCLSDITNIEEDGNNFTYMVNYAPHSPCLLQLPNYIPAVNVDNTPFEDAIITRKDENGNVLTIRNALQASHYYANIATMIKLGEWLDYMKLKGVYDNTRIILVADHGYNLRHRQDLIIEDIKDGEGDVEKYYPLLLVKDFNSKEFTTSNEFMTNADVPSIAFKDVIANPINPFTGRNISSLPKLNKQYVLASDKYKLRDNTGSTFKPGRWYSVHSNILDKRNWKLEKEEAVLPY